MNGVVPHNSIVYHMTSFAIDTLLQQHLIHTHSNTLFALTLSIYLEIFHHSVSNIINVDLL